LDAPAIPPGYEGFLVAVFGPERHRRVDGSFPVDPAAAEAVWDLYRLGLGVLVASGTLPGQSREAQLINAGVREVMLAVLHSDQLGVAGKSDPAFFAAIVEASGCDPAEICYVGNRLETDVQPALRAGMRAVLVAPPDPASATASDGVPDEVPVIAHLRELPSLFAGTAGRAL
jgi:FMN phosphatase YigB (HAD superfamily)